MRFDEKCLLLYAVTDRSWLGKQDRPKTLAWQVEQCLAGGVTMVQLREKGLDESAFLEEASEIRRLCSRYGVPLIINDRVDIALKCGADGVHVGQTDLEAGEARRMLGDGAILGVSARTVEQAVAAERSGADYLGVGAVFGTTTKQDAKAISWDTLGEICRSVTIPVVAIGGIGEENILKLAGSGAAGVAVISAIFASPDIRAAALRLRGLSMEMTAAGRGEERG